MSEEDREELEWALQVLLGKIRQVELNKTLTEEERSNKRNELLDRYSKIDKMKEEEN